jgi:phasin family protein
MTKNPFFESWMKPEMNKTFSAFSASPFDMKCGMECMRKNIQAITEANQISMESLQTVAQRQAEIVSHLLQDQNAIIREIMNEGTPEEKIARGAELVRHAYEKTVQDIHEVGDIVNKSSREATDVISKRIATTLNEIRDTAEDAKESRQSKGAKKAA